MLKHFWKVLFSLGALALLIAPHHAAAAGSLQRVAGPNRIGTAIEVSQQLYPNADSAGTVIITRHDAFPDALTASSLAGLLGAPILLTPPNADLDPVVHAEIDRVLPAGGSVLVIGGTAAVSDSVIATLQGPYSVERIAGANRYETAVRIKERADSVRGYPLNAAFFSRGDTYPDALSISSYAALSGTPIVLVESDAVPVVVQPLLTGYLATPYILGGTNAVSDNVVGAIESATGAIVTRISGQDRYSTSAAIAEYFFPNPLAITIGTGQNFPDALAGGVLAGITVLTPSGTPVLLIQKDSVPAPIGTYLADHSGTIDDLTSGYVLGGSSAIGNDVEFAIEAVI
ncbi:MAG: cell wall-binding repeat-containing protein [bacterium]|nr:cell wall-binding repeat-containing protein [bacterium]